MGGNEFFRFVRRRVFFWIESFLKEYLCVFCLCFILDSLVVLGEVEFYGRKRYLVKRRKDYWNLLVMV